MRQFLIHSFPQAIFHVDGDAFFVSCEVAKNPALRGRAVVTGAERGIASAMSYEAKRLGITRATPISRVRHDFPEVIILPSDYETYELYSRRMYDIVRRYTPDVEEYSIDECFADLTGTRRPLGMSYEETASAIKRDLESELGITFSVGLAPSKVLSKLGSKHKKPAGLTVISGKEIGYFLEKTPIEKVWGVGPNTSSYLGKLGVSTALQFAEKEEAWVKAHLTKPHHDIWRELRGESVNPVIRGGTRTHQSVSVTRTFAPSRNQESVARELSKNIETATARLRHHGLFAKKFSFFLKTNDFRYRGLDFVLSRPVSAPYEFLNIATKHFPHVWSDLRSYRATGVVLSGIVSCDIATQDLFGESLKIERMEDLFRVVDEIDHAHGKKTVVLGSSLSAISERPFSPEARISSKKRLAIPFLGAVR